MTTAARAALTRGWPAGLPLVVTALWALAQARHAPWLVAATLGVGVLFALGLLAPPGRRGDAALGGGLALWVAALYLRTLSPTTDIGDSLEWVVIARSLGVGHGPGYPLYVLLGKAFQALPLGDLAWRMNLLSAAAGVLTVVLVYVLALRLTGVRLAALSGALLLAVSTAFWSLAVITEVYTLQVALVAASLVCLERYTTRAREPDAGRWLVLTAFVVGLTLVQHLSNVFVVAVAGLAIAYNTPGAAWRPRRVLAAGLAFLLGLAPLLYFPLRWPAIYGRAVGAAELRGYLLGTDYRRLFFPERLLADPSRLWLYRHELLDQFSVVAVVLGLLGIVWLWRSRRQWAVWLGLLYALFVGARLAYYVWDGWVIQTPAQLVLAVLIAAGLAGLERWLGVFWPHRAVRAAALWSVAALLVVAASWSHGPRVDRSAGWPGYAVAQRALAEDLPRGAVLVADPDLAAGLLYEQWVRGIRPDVAIVYADTREGSAALAHPEEAAGPVYTLAVAPEEEDRHALRSLGPWVETARTPLRAAPDGFVAPAGGRVAATAVPVQLAGYRVEGDPDEALVPGTPRSLTLLWRADGAPAENLAVQVALVGPDGRFYASAPDAPVGGNYPFTRWSAGEYVTDYHELPVDWAMWRGDYDLVVSLVDASGAARVRWAPVARLKVAAADAEPPAQLPLRATWRDGPTLIGCDGCWPVRAGEAVPLRLYWRAGPAGTDTALDVVVTGPTGDVIRAVLPSLAPGQVLATDHPMAAATATPRAGRTRVTLRRAGTPVPRTGLLDLPLAGESFTLPGRVVGPAPAGLPAAASFADGMALVDAAAPAAVRPGQRAWVRLVWAARAAPGARYSAFVHLLDDRNERRAGTDREILHAARPTNTWQPGDELEDWVPVDVPADLPPGGYQWLVGLYDQATKVPLASVDAAGRPTNRRVLIPTLVTDPAPPPLPVAVTARLGDRIALDGARVGAAGGAAPGRDLPVTLRWRAIGDVAADYTIFVHLVRNGELVAQADTQPFGGALPTSAWPVGEFVDTVLDLAVPAGAPPGAYELHVGLYELASGVRLPVSGAAAGAPPNYVVVPVTIR